MWPSPKQSSVTIVLSCSSSGSNKAGAFSSAVSVDCVLMVDSSVVERVEFVGGRAAMPKGRRDNGKNAPGRSSRN